MIIANLATYPAREGSLELMVQSILPQVDVLNVYLNEFDEIPDFLGSSKINCVLGKDALGNIRDNGKFYFLKDAPENVYYFTVDDDIIYPKDYVQKLINKSKKYDNNVVVGVHGMIFPCHFFDFVETRRSFHFLHELSEDVRVSALGTGTIVFHVSCIKDLQIDFFEKSGMADLYFAAYCKESGVQMVCISHGEKWLSEIEQEQTLWNDSKSEHIDQNAIIKKYELWDIFPHLMNYYRASLENELMNCQNELQKVQTSKSFQLGNVFFRSVRNPYKLLSLPVNFFKIIFKSKDR